MPDLVHCSIAGDFAGTITRRRRSCETRRPNAGAMRTRNLINPPLTLIRGLVELMRGLVDVVTFYGNRSMSILSPLYSPRRARARTAEEEIGYGHHLKS